MSTEDLKLIGAKETAELLGISPTRLFEWRRDGKGPRYVKTGKSATSKILYPYKAIQEWIEDHSVTPVGK